MTLILTFSLISEGFDFDEVGGNILKIPLNSGELIGMHNRTSWVLVFSVHSNDQMNMKICELSFEVSSCRKYVIQWCCEAPTVPNSIGVRRDTHPNTFGKSLGNHLPISIQKRPVHADKLSTIHSNIIYVWNWSVWPNRCDPAVYDWWVNKLFSNWYKYQFS